MIAVLERPRQLSDAASRGDEVASFTHTHDVRSTRTTVNVEGVSYFADNVRMADTDTTGAKLRAFWTKSGKTMSALARDSGYTSASGIQRFLDPDYDKRLTPDIAERFARGLAGAVEAHEVLALTGLPMGVTENATPFQMEGASTKRMNRDVPIYGTALGADKVVDGEAIEQTMLNTADVIGHLRRPVILDGRADVYGLYVQGSSMAPRHRDGATIFVETRRRPAVGDDAVIYLRGDEEEEDRAVCVLIKTLMRKTANYIELEQYTPALRFKIDMNRVIRMDRVIPWDELVA